MDLTWPKLSWRRVLLRVAGVFVLTYAVAVLSYVSATPDIGIQCAFSPIIKQVDPRFVGAGDSDVVPQPGDQLDQVGHYKVGPVPANDRRPRIAQVLILKALQTLRDDLAVESDNAFQRLGPEGERQVLVKFTSRADGKQHTVWCRLGTLPLHELFPSILWFSLKVGLFAVGALVFWKRPDDRSAAQFFFLCIVTVGAYIGGYHWGRISTQPLLILTFMVCSVLLPAVSLHFYLVFPRPKVFFERRPGWTVAAVYGPPLLFLFALLASYWHLRGVVRLEFSADVLERAGPSSDQAVAAAWDVLRKLVAIYLWLAAAWYLASVACLAHSYRAAKDGTERNQVKWILYGSLLALLFISYTLYLITYETDDFGAGAATWPMFFASAFLTLAFAVSITRYRLMQLDQIVSSGVVYFFISSLAGLLYYAVVFAGMLAVGNQVVPGPSFTQIMGVSASFLLLMLALDMARSRFKKVLDRRFDRQKFQLDRTLRRMGQAIEQLVDPATLARRLLQASAELLNVNRGAVYVREGTPPLYRLAGSVGTAPALTELSSGCPLVESLKHHGAVVLQPGPASAEPAHRQLRFLGGEVAHALCHEGHLLALLVLGRKDMGSYGTDELNLLSAFAQFAALALESAQGNRTIEALNHELREKIEKISEQQRRILALQSQLTRQASRANGADAGEVSGTAVPTDGAAPALPAGAGLIGSSPAMRGVFDLVRKVSASQSAVLIRGESGTGKGVLARLLHENSARASKPFVTVHCSALSANLLESELFGHVKGAFTGAHKDKVGRFELAVGGTLFLDEIGDISPEVQTKLLRVLQEKTFERVGSSDPTAADVRVIAATHQNLEELIRLGRFREDLYYRLKVIDIFMPPLRERREDVLELALHFVQRFAERAGKPVAQIDDDAVALLKAYSWKGNVRELENVMESAVVLSEGNIITADHLSAEVRHGIADAEPARGRIWGAGDIVPVPAGGVRAERAERDRRERERLVRALAAAQGNKAEAARVLGLARSTLLSRLKKYGLA